MPGPVVISAIAASVNDAGVAATVTLPVSDGAQDSTGLGLGGKLRGQGALAADEQGRLDLPPAVREHLVPGGEFYMGDYVGLVAQSPGVKGLVERLRTGN